MTSTEAVLSSRRLAPIPGLLDDLVDQAIRARQRRVFAADHPGLNLAALRVADKAIDRALLAAAVYGPDALAVLDDRMSRSNEGERDAAVFLRIAFAVQIHEAGLTDLVASHLNSHERAVHEALRFAPVPDGPLSDNTSHIADLFAQAKHKTSLMPLALQLAGERDAKVLRSSIEPFQYQPDLAAWAHYALACMGAAGQATGEFVQNCLDSQEAQSVAAGLRISAVDPRLPSDLALEHALTVPPPVSDAAWAILACRYPRRVFDYAMSLDDLAVATKLRLAALTGFVDGAIAVCAELAEREGSITPAEADVLELVLGEVPAAARGEPNDRAARSKALRDLVLRVCRQAHVAIRNDADRCAWQVAQILADPAQAASVRVRDGRRLSAKVPALGRAVIEVTHGLRQWLYIERAALGRHPLALSALDVSRRQELALMIADFADGMRDP